jgi:hypothetical protein
MKQKQSIDCFDPDSTIRQYTESLKGIRPNMDKMHE